MLIPAVPITKLFAWGEGDSGGHVLRETTSRGLSGLVCTLYGYVHAATLHAPLSTPTPTCNGKCDQEGSALGLFIIPKISNMQQLRNRLYSVSLRLLQRRHTMQDLRDPSLPIVRIRPRCDARRRRSTFPSPPRRRHATRCSLPCRVTPITH